MATAKYDWSEIKQRYFESDITEVKEFLIRFLSINHKTASGGSYAAKAKGWRSEKEAILKAQTQKAVKDLENDPKVKIANDNILKAISNFEVTVAALIGQGQLTLDQAIKAKPLWEVLRVKMNLPTTYAKNDNQNLNTEIKVSKTIKTIISDEPSD